MFCFFKFFGNIVLYKIVDGEKVFIPTFEIKQSKIMAEVISNYKFFFKYLNKEMQKEFVVSQALRTKEVRDLFAKAMMDPIKRALKYQSDGHNLLLYGYSI